MIKKPHLAGLKPRDPFCSTPLCENPYLFMAVDDVREGYRRSVCGKHAVYYRVSDDAVEIMAVLKHQNPGTYLP